MRAIKILHVIDSLRAGGAEKLIDEMLPLLSNEESAEVELMLLSTQNNIFINKIKDSKVKVSYSPVKNSRSICNIFFLYRYIKNGEFDIVHTHLFPENYFIAIVAMILRRYDTFFITTEHSTYNRRRSNPIFKYMEKCVYKRYNSIISITQGTQDALLQWINPDKKESDKFKVINNGINIDDFKNAEGYNKRDLHEDFTEDTKLLCMVGSFSEAKDQKTIIKSLTELPESVELVLVGDGDNKKDLIQFAEKLKIIDRVKFLGIRNDVPEIYKTVDIVIVSSHWEGFGLVAVEGMAAGKPVVASDVEGLSEIIKDKNLLFEKGNYQELAKIVQELLSNNKIYQEILLENNEKLLKYDISIMSNRYLKEYISIKELN